MSTEIEWYEDHGRNLLPFARALVDGGEIDEVVDLLYFFEKPWKWTLEFQCWSEAGRPASFESVPRVLVKGTP